MRPRTVRRFYAFIAVGAFLTAAILFSAGVAKADPTTWDHLLGARICAALNANPSDAEMDYIATRMLVKGIPTEDAAQALAIAVTSRCPKQAGTVQHWATSRTLGISDVVLR